MFEFSIHSHNSTISFNRISASSIGEIWNESMCARSKQQNMKKLQKIRYKTNAKSDAGRCFFFFHPNYFCVNDNDSDNSTEIQSKQEIDDRIKFSKVIIRFVLSVVSDFWKE